MGDAFLQDGQGIAFARCVVAVMAPLPVHPVEHPQGALAVGGGSAYEFVQGVALAQGPQVIVGGRIGVGEGVVGGVRIGKGQGHGGLGTAGNAG